MTPLIKKASPKIGKALVRTRGLLFCLVMGLVYQANRLLDRWFRQFEPPAGSDSGSESG